MADFAKSLKASPLGFGIADLIRCDYEEDEQEEQLRPQDIPHPFLAAIGGVMQVHGSRGGSWRSPFPGYDARCDRSGGV